MWIMFLIKADKIFKEYTQGLFQTEVGNFNILHL